MSRLTVFIALCFSSSLFAQNAEQLLNVSGVQCQHVARTVTRQMVERDPKRYIDSCIQWNGVITKVVEADMEGTKVWVIPVEGMFAFCGSTLLMIDLYGMGGSDSHLGSSVGMPFDYLAHDQGSVIQRGDAVSFLGKILGVSKKTHPVHGGPPIERVLIAITEIHKIERDKPFRLPIE